MNKISNDKGWYSGDYVRSNEKNSCFLPIRLKYLADSQLDYDCFIAMDDCGCISDDWRLDEFDKIKKSDENSIFDKFLENYMSKAGDRK